MASYNVFFTNAGIPVTGLRPIWNTLVSVASNTPIVNPYIPPITELSGGWYTYSFNPTESLVGVIDGGISLTGADRYKPQQLPVGTPFVAGSQAVTLQLTDVLSNNPIPDVECLILNPNESLFINCALTNSAGQIQFQLNPGFYVLRLRKDGYNFTVPTQVVVTSGPVTSTYYGTPVGDVQADFRPVVVPRGNSY